MGLREALPFCDPDYGRGRAGCDRRVHLRTPPQANATAQHPCTCACIGHNSAFEQAKSTCAEAAPVVWGGAATGSGEGVNAIPAPGGTGQVNSLRTAARWPLDSAAWETQLNSLDSPCTSRCSRNMGHMAAGVHTGERAGQVGQPAGQSRQRPYGLHCRVWRCPGISMPPLTLCQHPDPQRLYMRDV